MNAIEIKGLTKRYGEFTLGPLDLVLPSGCIMGLVGKNGAGKSTTIKLILDLICADAGTVTILGKQTQSTLERAVWNCQFASGGIRSKQRDFGTKEYPLWFTGVGEKGRSARRSGVRACKY